MSKSVLFSATLALVALSVAPLAHAAGGTGGGGTGGGGKTVPVVVVTAPTPVPGTSVVVPIGTFAPGTVIGFAPAVPGFPPAPITIQPSVLHGE